MVTAQNGTTVDNVYKLPRGGREAIRLTAQHHVLTSRQGWLLHPKISNTIKDITKPRIADVATGTGVWALDMAQQMPHAEVIGLDISNQQFPPEWTWPPNMSLGLYDLLEEVPAEFQGQFDVVHVRLLLVAGPSVDKTVFIDRFRALLRPGGWLQWDDLSFPHITGCYQSPTGMVKSADPGAHPIVKAMGKHFKFGDKAGWLSHFEQVFVQAGGFDESERVEVPIRPYLLQMESDLVVAVMTEFVNVATSKSGSKDVLMLKEFDKALTALYADVHNGILFSYNWNVCISRKALNSWGGGQNV